MTNTAKYQGYNTLKDLLKAVKDGVIEYDSLTQGQRASFIYDCKIELMQSNTIV